MPIVKLPNGTRLNFPDGMSPEEMALAIDSNFPEFSKAAQNAQAVDARRVDNAIAAKENAGAGRGKTIEETPEGPVYSDNVVSQIQRGAEMRKQSVIAQAQEEADRRGVRTETVYDPMTGLPLYESEIPDSDQRALNERRTRWEGRLTDADIPEMTATGLARDIGSGAAQIPGVVVSGIGALGRLATADTLGKDTQQLGDRMNEYIRENWMSDRARAQAAMMAQDMEDPAMGAADVVFGNKGAVADMALPQVGSMALPLAAASIATKVATASKAAKLAGAIDPATLAARVNTVQTAAVGGTAAAQNAAEVYTEVKDKGGSDAEAYKGAAVAAAATLAANQITAGGLEGAIARGGLGKGANVMERAAAIALGAGKEFAQEGIEGAGGYVGKQVGLGQDINGNDLAKAIALEGTMGALMGGGGTAVGAIRDAAKTAAPRVQDMPTVPVAPVVTAKADEAVKPEAPAPEAVKAVENIAAILGQPTNVVDATQAILATEAAQADTGTETAPAAPEVQPATPVAQPLAPPANVADATQAILAAEAAQADTGTETAPAAPAVQPAADSVAATTPEADAVQPAPVAPSIAATQTTVTRDGKVIPAPVADPVAKLQQEMADLKARADEATARAAAEKWADEWDRKNAEAKAKANTGSSYQQTDATPTPSVSPKLMGVMVERAKTAYEQSVAAGKFPDLGDAKVYPEPVLYGIINSPDVGPELLTAARTELESRRGTGTQTTVNEPTGLKRTVQSDPAYAGQQPVITTTGSAVGALGQQQTATPDRVKYYAGATSTGVAPQAGANPLSAPAGGNAPVLGEAAPGGSQPSAGTLALGNKPAAQPGGIDSLPLADAASEEVLGKARQAVYKAKGVIVKRSARPLNYQQQVVAKLSRMMGKTVTFIERASQTGEMPNGFVNHFAGEHIFLDVDSTHPVLEVLMHEGTHALPTHIRDKLKKVVLQKVSQEGKEAFLKEYGYTKETDVTKDEEVTAFVTQLVAKNPRFFQDLRKSLGNRDFAELAKVIISKIKSWFNNTSDFDAEFMGKYVPDVQAVHDAAVQAYAEAMREMGVQPDADVMAPAFAQKEDGKGRVGKVSTHVLVAQRGERVKSDKTRVGADEKAIIREAAKKMGVTITEVEEMVRDNKAAHPASDGWAPLTLTGVKVDDDGKAELQYQTVPYSFNNDSSGTALTDGSPEYVAKVRNMAAGMLREVRGIYDRAQAGDGAAQKIIAQSGWYKEMRTRLRQEFGGMGDLFADLLGATSPNTPVRTNWDNSIEALRLATQGKFDALLPKWIAWARRVDDINTRFRARYNDMLESGMSKAAIKNDTEFKWLAEQASQIREFPDKLLPLKSNGKKFGFNGKNVVRAIIDLWRVVKNADPDIRLGGTAPKAINFSGNLIGFRSRATIDVWAARMLQRLSGGLRIPSMAEGGVTGEALESGRNTLQFGFGQDVFSEAVKLIRNDSVLSQDSTLRGINDDDLQALVWFIEKEVWTKGNWTSAAGEGGSFEFESDLAGVTDRDAVNQQRKIADSSVARSEEQTAAAQAEIERLTREMENFGGIPAANATLQANAEAVVNKTAKPVDVRASNAAAREALKKAKSTPQYKALVSERNRQKNILKKPTTEQRAQMRADAVQKLEGMSRTVDRYTAGLSIQKGAEQGMEPTPPTDAEMAGLIEKVTDAVTQGDPGATVVGLKAIATEGRYGAPERALDLEVITTDEFNPAPMAAGVFSAAQEADQDAAFVARVLRPDEEFDPLLHRPGIELYFRDMNQAAEAARMMAEIPSIRVAKPSEFGPSYFAIGGYTVVVDGRPSAQAQAGQMGKPVGMRVMYLPEFEARYGIDPRLENATDEELAGIVQERADDLTRFARSVLLNFEGVSFAGRFDYEVDTRFAGEYQGAIDAYTNGKSAGPDRETDGRLWSGRSNRESIAAATGRLQVDGSEPGAELPGGLDTQVPFSNKAGSGRTVEPDVQDGPGARPNAVRIRATHFSQQPRTSLDGRYNGTGLKGAERTRLSLATDPRIKERVYFYVDEGNGIRPESGVGGIAHSADLRNIYDVTGDPQKLFRSSNDNTNESALLDAGYDGYYVPKVFNNQGVVVVLGNASRGIKVEPTEYTKGQRPAEPEQPFKYGLTGKELNAIDMPAVQAVAPSAKLRMGTLQMAQADVAAARQELAKQGITLPADGPAFSNKAQPNLDQDITLEIPVEGGKTARLTINAQAYITQLDAREDALRMVKECLL